MIITGLQIKFVMWDLLRIGIKMRYIYETCILFISILVLEIITDVLFTGHISINLFNTILSAIIITFIAKKIVKK